MTQLSKKVQVIKGQLVRKWPEGKIAVNVKSSNPEEINFGLSQVNFKLLRTQVIENQLQFAIRTLLEKKTH